SWWNAGLFSGYDLPGIALGYLDNRLGQGNLLLSRPKPDEVAFLAESVYAPERVLRAGEMVGSNPFVILLAPDPYEALERYAEAVGTANGARTRSIVNGWSSWFYTLSQVTEEEMVSQAAFAAKHLKPYGLEYIQVDEGYQRWHGDWEGNERFPSGMKGFADRIRALGLRPGIWISPYVISEPTAVYREHPEWLVKNPDGSPQRVGNWPPDFDPPEDENPKRYCLDVTHPGAAQWLHDLVHTIAHDWGYELIKIDFVAWTILAARQFHDPTASTAVAYRRGMEIMRNAAGERCHILECGPGNVTVGLIDSMRIELDYNYGYEETSWDTYFLKPASSVDSAGKRFYFHGRTWVNDVDHLCMVHMDHEQSEAAATIIGMSGGNSMSGDRLSQLDPYRLEIFRRILPASGLAAKPIDLFESDIPTAFAVRVEKAFGAWTVAAFFNRSLTETVTRRFPLSRLWLDPDATYVAFDFWCQKLVGEVRGELEVSVLPGSVTLLALHEKRDRPFVLSTDRHILQGFVELDDVRWDAPGATLSGVSLGPAGSSHNVSVYLPEPHPWTWSGSAAYRDFGPYTLKLVDEHVLQVNVRFDESERVAWRVALEELVR
ncbi:MAG TPA: glycoside hydrolase family 36 protein, partial [Rhodothermales bacterium]